MVYIKVIDTLPLNRISCIINKFSANDTIVGSLCDLKRFHPKPDKIILNEPQCKMKITSKALA